MSNIDFPKPNATIGNCTQGDSKREPFVANHNIILAHAIVVHIVLRRIKELIQESLLRARVWRAQGLKRI